MVKCELCDREIEKGEVGATLMCGVWKDVDDDNTDFNPLDEWDMCGECAQRLNDLVILIRQENEL